MASYDGSGSASSSQSESGSEAQATTPLLPQLHREHSGPTVELRANRDSHLHAVELRTNVYVEEEYGASTVSSSHHASGVTGTSHHAGETAPTSYVASSRGEQKRKRGSTASSLYVNHPSSDDGGSSVPEPQMQTEVSFVGRHLPHRYSADGRREVFITYTNDPARIDPSGTSAVSHETPRRTSTPTTMDLEAASIRSAKSIDVKPKWALWENVVFWIILAALIVDFVLIGSNILRTHGEDPRGVRLLVGTVNLSTMLAFTLSASTGNSLGICIYNSIASCALTALIGVSWIVSFNDSA